MSPQKLSTSLPKRRTASRVASLQLPPQIWPALLAASDERSLYTLVEIIKRLSLVALSLEFERQGRTIADAARVCGVAYICAWRWRCAFRRGGLAALLPGVISGRPPKVGRLIASPETGLSLPVRINMDEVRFRAGRMVFDVRLAPMAGHLRRRSRRAIRCAERRLPAALKPLFGKIGLAQKAA